MDSGAMARPNGRSGKMNLEKYFKNKRVLVTGHTGFKGTWMCIWLEMMGAKVKGYALKPENLSLYNKVKTKLKVDSVLADIRDAKRVKKEILSFKPDFIFHLAAQPLVRESYEIPVETFDVNAIGTAHLLDALRFLDKKCVCVIVTTDKVYSNIEKHYAYNESDKLGGYDPYSASKAAAEIVTESFRLSFFNPADFKKHRKAVATGRAGNVIGGGDYAKDRIVPDIFRALSADKSIEVRNPSAIRPWQHVLEPLNGYLTLAAKLWDSPQKFATSYNFGPRLNDTFTVEELVRKSLKSWPGGKYKITGNKKQPHEAGVLKLDIRKAKKELHWEPRWNGDKAIRKTISWYRNSLDKKSSLIDLCREDINEYLSH
jgi:CDP-glucose 4,6-dehydratase